MNSLGHDRRLCNDRAPDEIQMEVLRGSSDFKDNLNETQALKRVSQQCSKLRKEGEGVWVPKTYSREGRK